MQEIPKQLETASLFPEAGHSLAYPYLLRYTYPWEILSDIDELIREIGRSLSKEEYDRLPGDVFLSKSAKIAPTACITGPAIIDHGAELRHCAFVRGNAIVGKNAVVGNSVELKNCILFDGVQVPHFNYVGDSVLGYKAHMGAGAVTSNVKSDKTPVTISVDGQKIETGRKKLGAILGDLVEIGCNSVLCPGTVIGRETNVYPLSSVRGYVPGKSIYKSRDAVIPKRRS